MSKNIIIQEGGVNKNLNSIKKILTDEQDGGSCKWIPEDEAERGTKTITKNGTYKASDDDLYGYSKVTVNVTGGSGSTPSSSNTPGSSVTGKDPEDEDGNEYSYTVNDDHEVIKTKIPSSIRVTKNPDKTSYQNGETINPSGIIVHAYYADGGDHGTILNSELTFEPLVADSLKVEGGGYTSDLDTGNFQKPIPTSDMYGYRVDYTAFSANRHEKRTYVPTGGAKFVLVHKNQSWNDAYLVSKGTPLTAKYTLIDETAGTITTEDIVISNPSAVTIDGKTAYYTSFHSVQPGSINNSFEGVYVNNGEYVNALLNANTAWTVMYGTASGGGQPITVKWNRPTDGKTLTDTFNIDVSPSANEESGGGGSHGF